MPCSCCNPPVNEFSFFVKRFVSLSYYKLVLNVGSKIDNFLSYIFLPIVISLDKSVRCLDKSVLIYSRIGA